MSENQTPGSNFFKERIAQIYTLHKHGSPATAWEQAKELRESLSAQTVQAAETNFSELDQLRKLKKDLARLFVISGLSALKQGRTMREESAAVMTQILLAVHTEYPIGHTQEEATAAAIDWRGVYHADAPSSIEALEDLVGLCEVLEHIFEDGRFLNFTHALLARFYYALEHVSADHTGVLKFRIKHAHVHDSRQAMHNYEQQRGLANNVYDLDEHLSLQAHIIAKSRGLSLVSNLWKYAATVWRGSHIQSGSFMQNIRDTSIFALKELLKKHPWVRSYQLHQNIESAQMRTNESVAWLAALFDAKRYVGLDDPVGEGSTASFIGINGNHTK